MDSRITLQLSSSSSTNHPETSGPKSLQEEINAMPLVDEDAPEVSDDDSHTDVRENGGGRIPHEASSIESMSSSLGSPAKGLECECVPFWGRTILYEKNVVGNECVLILLREQHCMNHS